MEIRIQGSDPITCMYNMIMDEIKFEWDENKNAINIKKHGVIRIISARRATHKEQLFCHEYNGG